MKSILTAIKYVLLGIIAISLSWIAFFKGGTTANEAVSPTVNLDSPVTPVKRGNVSNDVEMTGSIALVPGKPAKATVSGTIRALKVNVGDEVKKGQRIALIATEEEPAPMPEPAEGEPAPAPPKPKIKITAINAPEAGRIATLPFIKNQPVSIGDDVATLTSSKMYASASLSQENRYRLMTLPATANIKVDGGPAEFTCTNLRISDDPSSSSSDNNSENYGEGYRGGPGGSGGSASGELMCDIPEGTAVFPGLQATMTTSAGTANNVLTLPVTAVSGRVDSGNVWVQNPDGDEPIKKDVKLGLTNGEIIEITSGLAEGDEVLQYAPGERSDEGRPMRYDG